MGFKSENGTMLMLSLLLTASAVGLGWALTNSRFHLSIVLLTLVLILILMLFRRLTKTSREILFFFKALKNDDTFHFLFSQSQQQVDRRTECLSE